MKEQRKSISHAGIGVGIFAGICLSLFAAGTLGILADINKGIAAAIVVCTGGFSTAAILIVSLVEGRKATLIGVCISVCIGVVIGVALSVCFITGGIVLLGGH